jgi:hypothetical protein
MTTEIQLSPEQRAAVFSLAGRTGVSVSDWVGLAVKDLLSFAQYADSLGKPLTARDFRTLRYGYGPEAATQEN